MTIMVGLNLKLIKIKISIVLFTWCDNIYQDQDLFHSIKHFNFNSKSVHLIQVYKVKKNISWLWSKERSSFFFRGTCFQIPF